MSSVAVKRETDRGEVTVMLDEHGTVERLERLPSGTLLTDDWTIDPAEAARIVSELIERPPPEAESKSRWGFDAPDDGRPPNFRPVDGPETSGVTAFRDLAALFEVPEPEPAFPYEEPDLETISFNQESLIVAGFLIGASIAVALLPPLRLMHYSDQFRIYFDNMILAWLAAGVPFVVALAPIYAIAGLLAGKYATSHPTKVARNGGLYSLFIAFWRGSLFPPATFLVLPFIAMGFAWLVARRRDDLAEAPPEGAGHDLP